MPATDVSATPTPMPAANPQPLPQTPPVGPDWQNQAAADAASLPQGPDNYSVNSPLTPPPANPQPSDNLLSPVGNVQPPAAPAQPTPQAPIVEPTPAPSVYGQPADVAAPAAMPEANTLDLSNQPQITPQPPAPPVPGAMQPGVEVAPQPQITNSYDQANPAVAPMAPAAPDGGLPTDLGTSYNADLTGMAAAEVSKKRGPLKWILIAVAVIALILIIGLAIVFSARNQRKPAIELNEQPVQSTSNTTTTSSALPEGYKLVNRDCFSFGIVEQTTINFDLTDCRVAAKFGASSQYTIKVENTNQTASLQDYANSLVSGTKVSQENIKMGGIDSIKIVETVNGVNQQLIVTITSGKNYTFDGAPVNSFILITTYNDADSKTIGDNVVKTWTWK
jgi:hypothetical protein